MDKLSSMSSKKFFIANWKSHKTPGDVVNFLESVKKGLQNINLENKTIIIAPPYPLLPSLKEGITSNNLPFEVSSQDVSAFDEGAYTGEVSARLIKNFASYAIIGHSERRESFKESDDFLLKKVEFALKEGLTPIYCVQNEDQGIPPGVRIVAYEPPTAIGTGNPDDPNHIEEVFNKIKEKYPEVSVLYGGSVNKNNISIFLNVPNLSGFLIGGASLDLSSFLSLLSQW